MQTGESDQLWLDRHTVVRLRRRVLPVPADTEDNDDHLVLRTAGSYLLLEVVSSDTGTARHLAAHAVLLAAAGQFAHAGVATLHDLRRPRDPGAADPPWRAVHPGADRPQSRLRPALRPATDVGPRAAGADTLDSAADLTFAPVWSRYPLCNQFGGWRTATVDERVTDPIPRPTSWLPRTQPPPLRTLCSHCQDALGHLLRATRTPRCPRHPLVPHLDCAECGPAARAVQAQAAADRESHRAEQIAQARGTARTELPTLTALRDRVLAAPDPAHRARADATYRTATLQLQHALLSAATAGLTHAEIRAITQLSKAELDTLLRCARTGTVAKRPRHLPARAAAQLPPAGQ